LLPTLADVAHTSAPKNDGLSLLPLLTGAPQTNHHEFLFWQCLDGSSKAAIRMGRWKGISTSSTEQLEVYDLETDAGETQNVAAKNPEITSRLAARLKAAQVAPKKNEIRVPTNLMTQ
jgi:arylsulfatase A-like enzyme